MKIGYARVSTAEQNLALQLDALKKHECVKIYQDHAQSGAKRSRPQLDKCLAGLKTGDTLVVYKLDRLGRSLSHLVEIVADLNQKGIQFCSITEGFDTTTPAGKMIFHIIASLAEFERDLIKERVTAGIAAAQSRGTHCGRPKSIINPAELSRRRSAGTSVAQLMKEHGLSRSSVFRLMKSV